MITTKNRIAQNAAQDPNRASIELPADAVTPGAIRNEILYQLIYSIVALVFGFLSIAAGVLLAIYGISGTSDWTFKVPGLGSTLSHATPGVMLTVAGVLIISLTRFKTKSQR
jgi:hypothetical protein